MSWWGMGDQKLDFCDRHQMTVGADGVCPADAKVRLPAYPVTWVAPTGVPIEEVTKIAKDVLPDATITVNNDRVFITGAEGEQLVEMEVPPVTEIKIGDVWRDIDINDTVIITNTTVNDSINVTWVEVMFGDGSGPSWYRVSDFLNDCEPVTLSSRNPQIGETVDPSQMEWLDGTLYVTTPEVDVSPIPNPQYRDYDGGKVVLNPDDPFEAVVLDMVKTNRAKRADYAVDGSPFSNFDDTSESMGIDGFGAVESALFNVNQKTARLKSLRKNGRMDDTANESVTDTYLDLAVYACIALAIHKYPTGIVA